MTSIGVLDELNVSLVNSAIPWTFIVNGTEDAPPLNTPVFALVENDTVDPTEYPAVLYLELVEMPPEHSIRHRWRLVDFDPHIQDEDLQQHYTVIAWRLPALAGPKGPWIFEHE